MFCKYSGKSGAKSPQPEVTYYLKFGSELLGTLHVSITGRTGNDIWYKRYSSFEEFMQEWEIV